MTNGGVPFGGPFFLSFKKKIMYYYCILVLGKNTIKIVFFVRLNNADCSGLRLNREKSEFTGFGLSLDEESQCSRALGTPMGTLPIRYLGLPLSTGQLRGVDWQSIVGKVEQ